MIGILAGIRVLDFGRYIAGPYCAAMLGYLGAEVIRIERPGGNEDRYLVPVTATGDGGLFLQVNANKLGMTLDMGTEDGRSILTQLIKTADVVVANFPPDTLKTLGLDYDSLRAIKPDIILAANTVYGSSGPYANRVGFDGVAQAMSGAIYMNGWPDQPVRASVTYVDFASAMALAFGTLAALMQRQQTGSGQMVETSLLATAMTMTNGMLIEQALTQANRVPTGNRSQITGPADIFATEDGFIIVQVIGPYIFKRWARLMGEKHWLTDPRFADDVARGQNRDVLSERMGRWCGERTTAVALTELEAARIPCGPVLNYREALDHPYVQELNHLKPLDYPGAPAPIPIADAPFGMSETAVGLRHRAPTLGEHTDQILQQLGYPLDEITHLRKTGIV
jgi:crotonobetainyl-CoA:carnitine CoA-transferase CaiB-like acyl-CoA transferase